MISARLLQSSHLARASIVQASRLKTPTNDIARLALFTANTNWKTFTTSPCVRSGDHSKTWSLEKGVAALAVPTSILPFIYTTPVTDAIFCTVAVLHSYWGMEAIVVDYVRPSLFGGSTVIPTLSRGLMFGIHAFMLGALFYFNYTDVGLVNAVKMFWKL